LGFGYRHAVAQKNPVGVRAAQITGGCVIIAAIIGVAGKIDGIWKRSESQSINISNSPTQAPIVQAASNAHVTVNATPPLRDVQADASRPVRITTYIASESPYLRRHLGGRYHLARIVLRCPPRPPEHDRQAGGGREPRRPAR